MKMLDASRPLPRVFDTMIFNDELDMLEIRMQELKDVVDFFVIVESRVTHSNKPKPLVFEQNKARFNFVADKVGRCMLTR